MMSNFYVILLGVVLVLFTGCGSGSTQPADTEKQEQVGETSTNQTPTAKDQNITLNEDTNKQITLSGEDLDGDSLTYHVETNPTNGTLSGTAPNLTYTPDANFNGNDSFTFKVNDGQKDSEVATLSITVSAINDTPTASDQNITLDEDTNVSIVLKGVDLDGDSLTYHVETNATNGTLSGTAPNLTYTPNANFNGSDSFTFYVNDGTADSASATISITINPINDTPIASPQSITLDEDTSKQITLSGEDLDGDSLTYTVIKQPTNGTLSGTAPNLTYTPNANYFGSDSFTFKVNDGSVDSQTATVNITVNDVIEPVVLFLNDGQHGYEPWVTDGTKAGTKLLRDINKNNIGSNPRQFTDVNGVLYFIADDEIGLGLWKSDGTEDDTVKVKSFDDIRRLSNFMSVGGVLYFTIDSMNGKELWKSDGTENGTVKIKDGDPSNLTGVGEVLYFTAYGENGNALYKSDETGTKIVKNNIYPSNLTNVNGTLYFTTGRELWVSDGTTDGTTMVKSLDNVDNLSNFMNVGGTLYFIATRYANTPPGTYAGEDRELWKSDGTADGTTMVKNLDNVNNLSNFMSVNGVLYFTARDNTTYQNALYKFDEAKNDTVKIKDGDPSNLIDVNGVLYFVARDSTTYQNAFYKSDGTTTEIVKDNIYPSNLTDVNGTLYFTAYGENGNALYKSDGTTTEVVKEGIYPYNLTNVDGTLYFSADNSKDGNELWISNGTDSGTTMVKNINNMGANSVPNGYGEYIVAGFNTYFIANDSTDGRGLWVSDGTESGTVKINDKNPSNLTDVNGVLYFVAYVNMGGGELWKSDGTTDGTTMVKSLDNVDNLSNFMNVGGTLYFAAYDNTNNTNALYKFDETKNDTVEIKGFDNNVYGLSNFTDVGEVLYFTIDGMNGGELWKSNGTKAEVVKDNIYLYNLTNVDGTLYFAAYDNTTYQNTLYKSDETGTKIVKNNIYPYNLTNVDGTLYFAAYDNTTYQNALYKSDETGTKIVKNNIYPSNLTNVNGTLYFTYQNALYKSDGTENGTKEVAKSYIPSGQQNSSIIIHKEIDGKLLFEAYDENGQLSLRTSDNTHLLDTVSTRDRMY